jgi:type 2 lantibiotic biosynthesis protein LanM
MQTSAAKWYAATFLEERIEQLDKQQVPIPSENRNSSHQARKYFEVWQKQAPFNMDGYFKQRLGILGVSEDELIGVLSYPLATLREKFSAAPPKWLQKLDDVFNRYDPAEWFTQENKKFSSNPLLGFLTIVAPFIQDATHRFHEVVEELYRTSSEVPFDRGDVQQFFIDQLHEGLLQILNRALVSELKLAKALNRLEGETPEDRFMSFTRLIAQTDMALDILGSYPVMVRQIVTYTDNWVATNTEFLRRLCQDYQAIQAAFAGDNNPLGTLVAIQGKLSDSHRGGRTVMIATFSSGIKIVYKPKSLLIDARFQELLAWFNNSQDTVQFRLTKLLPREAYGWCEYCKLTSCDSEEEVQRFYFRMGAYLAILYSLKGTDFHSENIIAMGENPILIDLETLFQNYPAEFDFEGASRQAAERLHSSVLNMGLLPERLWGNTDGVAVDLSGLGALRTQPASLRGIIWEGAGTDEMEIKYGFVDHKQNVQSRPMLNDQDVKLSNYSEYLEQGFITFYRLIMDRRSTYIGLITSLFNNTSIRFLVRPTQLYYMLLRESYNPKHQRDSLSLNRLLDKLWLQVPGNPRLVKIISSERQDILLGDIPVFTSRVDSRHLWDSHGNQISDFFGESGLELAKKVINRFGDDDLQEQLWIIRTTMTSLTKPSRKPPIPKALSLENIKDRLLATTCKLVDQHLQPLASKGVDDLSWLVFSASARHGWRVNQADMNLYDGVNGIALFLAYLGQVTGENQYTHLAEGAMNSMRLQMQHHWERYDFIGAFEGWGSIIYGLSHLGLLWNRNDLLLEAEEVARIIPSLIKKDTQLDIIAGSAGCITSLLNLYQINPKAELLEIAHSCGEHLLDAAITMPTGIGWKNHIAKNEPFSGFSHGAAGIAWSLFRLADMTGNERFYQAAMKAIAYERSLFIPETGNWRDLRSTQQPDVPGTHQCALAWCHGAPGVGLGRLLSLPYLDDDLSRQEIDIALKTTIKHGFGTYHPGFGQNYSLCHGDLGNLDIVLETTLRLEQYSYLKPEIYKWAAIILNSIQHHGWLCGVPHGLLTPGLMTGIAGIGYGLLRLAAPEQVPSVLALDAPLAVTKRQQFINSKNDHMATIAG